MTEQLALPEIEPATKRCSRCRLVKPWRMFYMRKRNGNTRPIPFCRKCAVKRVLKWKREAPEAYAAFKRERVWIRRASKEKLLGKPRRCEICGGAFVIKTGRSGPQYDHNHGTGAARGWLCGQCNTGIGALGDNPKVLERAIEYLRGRGYSQSRPVIQ